MLALLYLAAPLHQTLLKGFHKLEHAITQTSFDHDHAMDHELNRDHAHDHKTINFFTSIFTSETEPSETNKVTTQIKLDKHYRLQGYAIAAPIIPVKKHIFIYCSSLNSRFGEPTTPPPKSRFS